MKRILFAAVLAALPCTVYAQTAEAPHDHDATAMHHDKPPVPPSRSLTVSFQGHAVTLSVEELLNLPQTTVHVHNAHRNTDEDYTGPLVADVLAKAGLIASKETEPLILHAALIATGTDKYFVLYSVAEVEPMFATGKVIVAVMKANLPNTDGGTIQLINTADAKPARWVHGLASLTVSSIAPAH